MSKLPAIFVVSDLHLDTGPFEWPAAAMAADLIIVAGDLANGEFDIDFLTKPGKPLVFVPGNHDFWSKDGKTDMFDIYRDMKRAAAGTNVHVLWDEEVILCGVRILGTPLWTDFGKGNVELMRASFNHSRDYQYINARSWYADPSNLKLHQSDGVKFQQFKGPDAAESGAFTPLIAYTLHQQSLAFITAKLKEPYAGRTILVTHMAPTYESLRQSGTVREHALDPKFWECRGRDNTDLARVASYASDLEPLFRRFRSELDLAVHGHIHASIDLISGSTRVIANPRGRYSGPLTEDAGRDFALFGYPVSAEQISKSQARFESYPYWGDNWSFEPEKLIRLEDGLAPALQPLVDELLPRLAELHAEVAELAPFVAHRKPPIRLSVQEAVTTRATKFDEMLCVFLAKAADAFEAPGQNAGWWAHLRDMGLPKPSHALVPYFNASFERKADPKGVIEGTLAAMEHAMATLPLVPSVPELACARVAARIQVVLDLVRSKGYTPELKSPAPEGPWRKLYFNIGTLELTGVAEDDDETAIGLDQEVDEIMNGGPPPRQVYLSVCGAGGVRLPVKEKTAKGEW